MSNIFIAEMREIQFVVGAFDDDFVRPQVAHPIVNALSRPPQFAFDAVKWAQMGEHPDLPVSVTIRL